MTWRGNTLKREQEIGSILKNLLTGKNILKSFQYLKYFKKQSHDFVTQLSLRYQTQPSASVDNNGKPRGLIILYTKFNVIKKLLNI